MDFDDQFDRAAPAARAGARFKPKGRPQPKKKQGEDPVSLDGSYANPNKASTSETIVPESGTINQSSIPTLSEKNADVFSKRVNFSMEPSVLRACTNVGLEEKRCDDDPITQDSAVFRDFDTHAQTERMQTGEEECRLDMESLDIVQEEGITSSAYEKHSGKFQPKPRLLDTVIEEPESQYSVDDTGFYSMGTNESEFATNVESRNNFNKNTPNYGELQDEERSIPQVPREMVPEMEARNASGEEQVVSPSTNNTVLGEEENGLRNTVEEAPKKRKLGKKGNPRGRKRRTTSEKEEANKSNENPKEKKFKHSVRRQRKRTLEKELLETPDDEIRFLPIKDMLRLVEYKEWLEKKEAKGAAAVVPPTQESDMNASENQDYSHQGFDAEDEFGMEESEYQETNVVKPDSPVNYQTYMNKTPRTRWSKQDTELFYEGIQEFGSNLSMVQQLFPDRTRQQIKLKFKLEERRHPLKVNDALSSRSKHLTHFQTVIKKLQQEAAAAREGEEEEEGEGEDEAGEEAETTTDVPENEEPVKSDETERAGDGVAGVKESDGEDVENGVRSDDGNECDDEGDDDFWNSYQSDM
uniref:Transcription factor TFIIIB component B n=1 Tax=Noccaea caerulescens TaxID=107243 RepID=A0A1J3EH19_NOCCA